jgi:hypothetical protein
MLLSEDFKMKKELPKTHVFHLPDDFTLEVF